MCCANENTESVKKKIRLASNMQSRKIWRIIMQTKKINRTLTIGLIMLALAIVTGSIAGFTFAKYSTSISGTDSANVAKWDVTASEGGNALTSGEVAELDLFATINDTGDGAAETDVDAGLIAPGTTGVFNIVLNNKSEVTVQSSVDIVLVNTDNIPVYFTYDSKNYAGDADGIVALDAALSSSSLADGESTYAIAWTWAFEATEITLEAGTLAQSDAADTVIGASETAATLGLTITVTFSQAD